MRPRVAIVHDHLVQRGGAERVVVALIRAFPDAPVYTSVYDSALTYPELATADIRPLVINRIPAARSKHRFVLPLLPAVFSALRVDADVTVCSSAGWSHGARSTGHKLIYWHSPNRWIHSIDDAFQDQRPWLRIGAKVLRRPLAVWDRRSAASGDLHLANSTAIRTRVEDIYGFDVDVLHPPSTLATAGPDVAIAGIRPGFVLLVSRLRPYKNVVPAIEAFRLMPDQRLLVVGTGQVAASVYQNLPENVRIVGRLSDDQLRWAYRSAKALLAPAFEDFGLTPIEANAFEKPVAALRAGGYTDTVIEHKTGLFFDEPTPTLIADVVGKIVSREWDGSLLLGHAERFGSEQFTTGLRAAVAGLSGVATSPNTQRDQPVSD